MGGSASTARGPQRAPGSPHHFRGVAEAALYCAHRTSIFLSCAVCEQGSWPPVSRTCVTRKPSFQLLPLSHPLMLAGRRGPRLRASNEGLLRPRVLRAGRALLIASRSPHTPFLAGIDSRSLYRPDSVAMGQRQRGTIRSTIPTLPLTLLRSWNRGLLRLRWLHRPPQLPRRLRHPLRCRSLHDQPSLCLPQPLPILPVAGTPQYPVLRSPSPSTAYAHWDTE